MTAASSLAAALLAALPAAAIATPAQANEVYASAYVSMAIGACMYEAGHWSENEAIDVVLEYLYDHQNYPRKTVDRVLQDESLPRATEEYIGRKGGCPAVISRFLNSAQDNNRRGTLSDTPFRF